MLPQERAAALSSSRLRAGSSEHDRAWARRSSPATGRLVSSLDEYAKGGAELELQQLNGERDERQIELQLLLEIAQFVARKELGARVRAPVEWRGRRRAVDNNLFELVTRVCENRIQRLQQHLTSPAGRFDTGEWAAMPRSVLMAEAIVQELLVSLIKMRMEERKKLVLAEVDSIDAMKRLQNQIAVSKETVQRRVCAGTGDEEQLREVQAELLADFMAEIPPFQDTRQRSLRSPTMSNNNCSSSSSSSSSSNNNNNSNNNNDTSLQFAWETIHEQKKEIVRLRAENDELKQRNSGRVETMNQSFFGDDKKLQTQSIDLLRSQISSHHGNNVAMMHEHIHNLEKALHRATSSVASASKYKRSASRFDASSSTTNSSRDHHEPADLSRSALHASYSSRASNSVVDFSRSVVTPRTRSCEECHHKSISILSLEAETRRLRAQLEADEEALLSSEKDQTALRSDNAALREAMALAAQKQEELRNLVFELRGEKKQLQQVMESMRSASETTSRHLTAQIADLEAQIRDSTLKKSTSGGGDSETSSNDWSKASTAYQGRLSTLENAIRAMQDDIQKRDALIREVGVKGESCEAISSEKLDDARLPSIPASERAANQLKELRGNLTDAQQRVAELEEEKKELKRTVARLKDDVECRDEESLRLQARLDRAKRDNSGLESTLQNEKAITARAHQELEDARTKLASLKHDLGVVRNERSQLSERLETTLQRLDVLKTKHEEVSALNNKLTVNAKRLERICEDASTAKHELTKLQATHNDLLGKHKEHRQQSAAQIEHLQRIHTQLSQEVSDTKTTVLAWMSKHNSMVEAKSSLEKELVSALEEKCVLEKQLEEDLSTHSDAIASLRRELEAKARLDIDEAIRKADSRVDAVNESVEADYRSRVDQLEQQNEVLRRQIGDQKATISSLSAADDKRKKTLALVESASHQLNEEIRTTKIERQKLQQQLTSSDRERAMLKLLVETLEARPQLQKRSLVEMITRCCRELEATSFSHIFGRLQALNDKIENAQQRHSSLLRGLESKRHSKAVGRHMLLHRSLENQAPKAKISVTDLAPAAVVSGANRTKGTAALDIGVVFDGSGSGWFQPVSPSYPARTTPIDSIEWNQRREIILERWQRFTGHLVRAKRAATVVSALKVAATEWRLRTEQWKQEAFRWKEYTSMWRWRYAARSVVVATKSRHLLKVQHEVTGLVHTNNRLKASVAQYQWRTLRTQLETTAVKRLHSISNTQVAQVKRLLALSQLRVHYNAWYHASKARKLSKKVDESEARHRSVSAAFTPEAIMALGSCIYLLQRFCDDDEADGNQDAGIRQSAHSALLVGSRQLPTFTRESLIAMLRNSNHKIARWHVILDKKLSELASSKKHLHKFKTRCTELNSLVALNQRLIGEMERRVAARQRIVEAAWDVTASFRRLPASSPVKAEAGDFVDLAVACNALTDALHSFRVSRLASGDGTGKNHSKPFVQSIGPDADIAMKRVKFTESTAHLDAPATTQKLEAGVAQRDELSTLNISILEDAISSLQSVGKNRETVEKALADAHRLLHTTRQALRRRNLQFHALRAFIQWRCVTLLLRLQARG